MFVMLITASMFQNNLRTTPSSDAHFPVMDVVISHHCEGVLLFNGMKKNIKCRSCEKLFWQPLTNSLCTSCKKRLKTVVCRYYGKEFETKFKNRIFCKAKCSANYQKKKYKENYNPEVYNGRTSGRFLIFERDGFKCSYCGKSSIEDKVKLVVDHVYPRIYKGNNNLLNLTTSCVDCNGIKHAKIFNPNIIFRIWKRNMQLNIKFKHEYKDLLVEFNYLYPKNKYVYE